MRNAMLALVAAVIAWWLWRRKDACGCVDVPTIPAIPVSVPSAPNSAPSFTDAPPPPALIPPSSIWAPPSSSLGDQCIARGGVSGWDDGFRCYMPETAPVFVPTPPPRDPVPQTCAQLGGVTLADGSCCVPPCAPPPPFTGYTSDPYAGTRTGGGPPAPVAIPVASPPRAPVVDDDMGGSGRRYCERTNGTWTGGGCACPPGYALRPTNDGLGMICQERIG